MWECNICKKRKVSDKGFRVFIKYDVLNFFGRGEKFFETKGTITRQIRICDKCLKKKGQNLEIEI